MANPFANLLSSFFPQNKAVSVLGIDVGSSSVKIVQLKKKDGKAVLETYGEVELGPYAGTDAGRSTVLPTEKIAEVIRDLLKESNTTTVNSGLSISIGSSFVVFIKMPTNNEKDLAQMVPLEARKYIPVPISEVTLDWWAIPRDEATVSEFQNGQKVEEEKGTEVLLVVIHNDSLAKNKDLQKLVPLDVTFSEVEIFSSVRASLEPSLAPQMIMDFGASSTKIFIVERGILKASHVINRGSQDITMSISKSMTLPFDEAEKIKKEHGILDTASDKSIAEVSSVSIDYILAEAERFVAGYYKKSGKKISKIMLTGGGALLKGLPERAKKSFETDVLIADPFSKIEYPAFLEGVLKTAGPEFTVAIGLAIRKLQEI